MATPAEKIFGDLATVTEIAREAKRTERTILNWCNEPDGLPWVRVGKTRYIPVDEAREWLKSRIVRPNPTGKPGRR